MCRNGSGDFDIKRNTLVRGTLRLLGRIHYVAFALLIVGANTASRAEPNVVELSVSDVQAAYQSNAYTAAELVSSFLDRIEQFEPTLNAFVSLNPNSLQRAQELDAAFAIGGSVGPLHGVPIVLKDNIDYAGMETTAGFAGFSSVTDGVGLVPNESAIATQRLMDAGAIILGKTNLPDFAFSGTRTYSSVAGATSNPYNSGLTPGGSSGGTATAINASFAVVGIGTETGGSIQNPASAQALVGVKPTHGLVPLDGVIPQNADYLDVVGPMARNVTDAALVLEVLTNSETDYVASLQTDALVGKRFGLIGANWPSPHLPLADETQAFYNRAVDVLVDQGAEVVDDVFADEFKQSYQERGLPSLFASGLEAYLQDHGPNAAFHSIAEWEQLSGREFPFASSNVEAPSEASLLRYEAWRHEFHQAFTETLDKFDLDGLFFPQAAEPIPTAYRFGNGANDFPELPSNVVNDLGVPVVTVPFGYYDDNSPMTLAFIGDHWSEAELLSYAFDFEQATQARRPPDLVAIPGDLNADGTLDADDIDQLVPENPQFDLNDDGQVDRQDRLIWLRDFADTTFGDTNLDGQFNSTDLRFAFLRGQYEDELPGNSQWTTGDWDGNREFEARDLVIAFEYGGYESGVVRAVPEASELTLGNAAILTLGVLAGRRNRYARPLR